MPTEEYWAHTPPDDDPHKPQLMRTHIENVAALAMDFAAPFGAAEIARWAAWLHDVGKYSPAFQDYLKACHVAKMTGKKPPKAGSAEHKVAGTRLALELLPPTLREMAALCVLGHHGGLNAFAQTPNLLASSAERHTQEDTAITSARSDFAEIDARPDIKLPAAAGKTRAECEMLIRFVFSCLVDADGLDTEQHSTPDKARLRQRTTLDEVGEEWLSKLQASQDKLQADAKPTRVNEVRREVYEACLAAATRRSGLFSLTVPTGGGKTRSSLAFALKHALANEQLRIIYALPYTTIIDQTAAEFRKILGEDSVLEHHSAMEDRSTGREDGSEAEDARDQQRKLDAENWNAPLIVTTTVQLFESLFSNRTGRCRKVHNIAKSVIILDEVQTLPAHLLHPLLDGLRTLIAHYGVTVVLCTATQPAITGESPFLNAKTGLGEPTAIIPAHVMHEHFRDLKRVTYHVETEPWTWEQTAGKIREKPTSCLAVLNTKNDALALLRALHDPDALHLSTLLCGEHRRHVLDAAKVALKAEREGTGPPIRLVTTQVIEAGCNIDFPRLFRARGPLDRIIQAAGRCNREGRPDFFGEVIVFNPAEGKMPPGDYVTAMQEAWMMISSGNVDFDSPALATEFFARFYSVLGPKGLDRPKAVKIDGQVFKAPVQEDRGNWNFPLVARKMRLIDSDTTPVLVPYHDGKFPEARLSKAQFDDLVDQIQDKQGKNKSLGHQIWRSIQTLTVAVRTQSLADLPVSPAHNPAEPAALYLWHGKYDKLGTGDSVDFDISDLLA